MSTNYFFKSLNFENYRGIKKLSIENLRRVNLIGGNNGVGKTSILDGIFLMLARGNPLVISRPFMVRQSKLPFPNGFDYIFHDFKSDKIAKISGAAQGGDYSLSIESAAVNIQFNAQNTVASVNEFSGMSGGNNKGIKLTVATNNNALIDIIEYFQPAEDNIGFTLRQGNVAQTPAAAYVSSGVLNPAEDAQRYSILMKERRTERLYDYLRLLYSDLKNIQLLQEGGVPVLYVEFSDGSMVQTALLGGGFQMMLSISLLMMTIKNGVFLFDEIDNTIHYALLKDFWALVSRLADETNGQVFAVTHSRECVASAIEGFKSVSRLPDLAYFRLEEGLEQTNCIAYDSSDLVDAMSADWEIR